MKTSALRSQFPALTSGDLADASELAVLVVLASALETAIEALYAAHPALAGSEAFLDGAAPEMWIADAIVEHAAALRGSLDTYRHAVEWRRSDPGRRSRC
jgi:hypothetical protein